jgi:hypothetical protein
VTFVFLYFLTAKRINDCKRRTENLKKELEATEKKLRDAQVKMRSHEFMKNKEMSNAKR